MKHPNTLSIPEQRTAGCLASTKLLQLNSYVTTNPSSKSLNSTSICQIGMVAMATTNSPSGFSTLYDFHTFRRHVNGRPLYCHQLTWLRGSCWHLIFFPSFLSFKTCLMFRWNPGYSVTLVPGLDNGSQRQVQQWRGVAAEK